MKGRKASESGLVPLGGDLSETCPGSEHLSHSLGAPVLRSWAEEKTLAGWRAGGSLTPLERAGRREVDPRSCRVSCNLFAQAKLTLHRHWLHIPAQLWLLPWLGKRLNCGVHRWATARQSLGVQSAYASSGSEATQTSDGGRSTTAPSHPSQCTQGPRGPCWPYEVRPVSWLWGTNGGCARGCGRAEPWASAQTAHRASVCSWHGLGVSPGPTCVSISEAMVPVQGERKAHT